MERRSAVVPFPTCDISEREESEEGEVRLSQGQDNILMVLHRSLVVCWVRLVGRDSACSKSVMDVRGVDGLRKGRLP